jgi:molybdopterin-containing oxidoreductase family iron-sulfur binding subunit
MDRRTFLKIAGMGSLAFAAACSGESEQNLFSLIEAPDDFITGKANWYASTCRECPAGCGILAKNREGRVIKLEGNPLHPINRGKLCIRGHAALQGVYSPDRLRVPLIRENNRWRSIDYPTAIKILKEKVSTAVSRGAGRVRMVSEMEGETLWTVFERCMSLWRSPKPMAYEAFGYENLKKANDIVFQTRGLARYRMDASDFILGFGADFLETWLSPVEYARRFKRMHRFKRNTIKGYTRGLFFQVSPFRTLTGANADVWIPCRPGGETALCFALIKAVLKQKGSGHIPAPLAHAIERVAGPYSREAVVQDAGITAEKLDDLATRLMRADHPLILGTSALSHSRSDLQANIAVNLLNYILNPKMPLHDFKQRHHVELAGTRSEVETLFKQLKQDQTEVLLLNHVDPVYTLPSGDGIASGLRDESLFVVHFTGFMNETAQNADLVFPVALPLECWGEYSGHHQALSFMQPAMAPLTGAPMLGDIFLTLAGEKDRGTWKHELFEGTKKRLAKNDWRSWLDVIRTGGDFREKPDEHVTSAVDVTTDFETYFQAQSPAISEETILVGLPSLRFFDGRGADRPWLCEIPDPVTKIAWQTPLLVHPQTARESGCSHETIVSVIHGEKRMEAAVYETDNIYPGIVGLPLGQGHRPFGDNKKKTGINPVRLFSPATDPVSGAPLYATGAITLKKTTRQQTFARTDGSADQHNRKIALTIGLKEAGEKRPPEKSGLTMNDFPLTLPLPEGYDKKRDFYPPHDHEDYRWAMVIDLDRCIGCNACVAACYAENNIGVVGEKEVINGREMSWISIERYRQAGGADHLIFLPMLCQHCDNAPCESVCPVYAPHHSKEGLNNQIYNRCIGTRFCAQNCPYKVRRFNWFQWQWPEPLDRQLNPEVTVRSKGVMEKCSFCVQRIKQAHGRAKDEKRKIRDGEVITACQQTCPTGAITFGSLMDRESRVYRLASDRRAYQVMGYLNTKPAVIYLSKVVDSGSSPKLPGDGTAKI